MSEVVVQILIELAVLSVIGGIAWIWLRRLENRVRRDPDFLRAKARERAKEQGLWNPDEPH